MTQPEFVPTTTRSRVRSVEELPPAEGWTPTRPAEIQGIRQPTGRRLGKAGPDQGYALKLARQFKGRLETAGLDEGDVITGCLGVALNRASLYGRAPVIHDLELAFSVWGFLGSAPRDLIEYRRFLFQACGHDYKKQREIVDRVPATTLQLRPEQARDRTRSWRELIDVGAGGGLSQRPEFLTEKLDDRAEALKELSELSSDPKG